MDMAILPCLRYSTIPAIWNKGGFLRPYLSNGIKPVSHKFTGLNPLSQLGMFPIAFLIFVRCKIKREEQTTWISTSLLLNTLGFRLITHCYDFQSSAEGLNGALSTGNNQSRVGLKLRENISCLQECSEFWEENGLIILKCLAGREDLAWMNQEQAIAINWIFVK